MAQKKQTLFEQLTSEEAVEKYTDLKSSRGSIVIKATIVLITLAVSTVFFSLHISERSGDIRFDEYIAWSDMVEPDN
jgi:uncharacterized membrane protein